MTDNKTLYTTLFNAITDATRKILQNDSPAALEILLDAQVQTEEEYIEKDESK